jgi:hypothetical protein
MRCAALKPSSHDTGAEPEYLAFLVSENSVLEGEMKQHEALVIFNLERQIFWVWIYSSQ